MGIGESGLGVGFGVLDTLNSGGFERNCGKAGEKGFLGLDYVEH